MRALRWPRCGKFVPLKDGRDLPCIKPRWHRGKHRVRL